MDHPKILKSMYRKVSEEAMMGTGVMQYCTHTQDSQGDMLAKK